MLPLWGVANDVKTPRETAPVYNSYCQEISVGWGDYQFESLAFHDSRQKGDYRYTGHVFAKYMYHTNAWLSALNWTANMSIGASNATRWAS